MVHLPQSEPSIQSSAADNKRDKSSLIMALMMLLEGCILWGDIFGSGIIRWNYSICLEQRHVPSVYDHKHNTHMSCQR